MKILALDTASRYGSIALCEDERLLAEYNTLGVTNQTERLLPALRRMLEDVGWAPSDLEGFIVVHGPGSFTGVRVGLATVQGLALATRRPAVGVSSLWALALGIPFAPFPICAVLDARKSEVYTALYRWNGQALETLEPEQVASPERFLSRLEGPVLFVGEGAPIMHACADAFPRLSPIRVPAGVGLPRAGLLVPWALPLLREAGPDSAQRLVPVYLRAAEAELKLQRPAEVP